MKATIQFIKGIDEEVAAEVKLTRSRDGSTGTATFLFNKPTILYKYTYDTQNITGMFMLDEEGTLLTRDVKANYINGKPKSIRAVYIMKNKESWDRFMRFIERYSFFNNLTFTKSNY